MTTAVSPGGLATAGDHDADACFACGSSDLSVFYQLAGVPVHSCVLVDDAETARSFPTGEIRLELCGNCGFIQNLRFDPEAVDYTQEYEETQGFSPTFRTFAEQLVDDLDARFELAGKQVLEVGCGSTAEFLTLLCERTGASGVGIDPAHRPARRAAGSEVDVITGHYTDAYQHLTGDLVLSRHTLEHIQPVRGFVERLRRSVQRTPRAGLFIEVPDTTRVLREAAFWDIYHEHCSYFTSASLTRLVADAGFRVDDIRFGFGDQYLLLNARLGRGHPAVHDTVAADVASFADRVDEAITRWEQRLRTAAERGERTVLWGGGSKAVAFLTTIDCPELVAEVIDINPHKQGKLLPVTAHRVVAPAAAVSRRPDLVIAMNPIYRNEIFQHLTELGVDVEVVGLS